MVTYAHEHTSTQVQHMRKATDKQFWENKWP